MQKNELLPVPEAFCLPPFYTSGSKIQLKGTPALKTELPFLIDILYAVQPDAVREWPWMRQDDALKQRWMREQPILRKAFRRRHNILVRSSMIGALAEFIERMFWAEGRPVDDLSRNHLFQELNRMAFAPLNLSERIDYIGRHPDRYPSFIQLNLLQNELTKKMAVAGIRHDH